MAFFVWRQMKTPVAGDAAKVPSSPETEKDLCKGIELVSVEESGVQTTTAKE